MKRAPNAVRTDTVFLVTFGTFMLALAAWMMSWADFAGVLNNLAGFVALGLAVYGFGSWRAQVRGQAAFDARKEVFAAVLKWNEQLGFARSMFQRVTVQEGETDHEAAARDRAERQNLAQCAYLDFIGKLVMLRVLVPDDEALVRKAVEDVHRTWFFAADADKQDRLELLEEERDALYDRGERVDSPFGDKLNAAMKLVEDTLGQHLREHVGA